MEAQVTRLLAEAARHTHEAPRPQEAESQDAEDRAPGLLDLIAARLHGTDSSVPALLTRHLVGLDLVGLYGIRMLFSLFLILFVVGIELNRRCESTIDLKNFNLLLFIVGLARYVTRLDINTLNGNLVKFFGAASSDLFFRRTRVRYGFFGFSDGLNSLFLVFLVIINGREPLDVWVQVLGWDLFVHAP